MANTITLNQDEYNRLKKELKKAKFDKPDVSKHQIVPRDYKQRIKKKVISERAKPIKKRKGKFSYSLLRKFM